MEATARWPVGVASLVLVSLAGLSALAVVVDFESPDAATSVLPGVSAMPPKPAPPAASNVLRLGSSTMGARSFRLVGGCSGAVTVCTLLSTAGAPPRSSGLGDFDDMAMSPPMAIATTKRTNGAFRTTRP